MLLSEAIRTNALMICPRCKALANFVDMLDHLMDNHLYRYSEAADWVAEQEKRLGIAEDS